MTSAYTTPTSHTDEEIRQLAVDFTEGRVCNLGINEEMKYAGIAFCYEYINNASGNYFFSCRFLNQSDYDKLRKFGEEYVQLRTKFIIGE